MVHTHYITACCVCQHYLNKKIKKFCSFVLTTH
nr:MAG TPA: hypothetical protein [Caudoviricetes sp.]